MLKNILSLSFIGILFLLSSCGGSRHTTVIVVQDPLRVYTIDIIKMSAVNPVGDTYVTASNKYDSVSVNTTSVDIVLTDKDEKLPILFSLNDDLGTIFSQSINLNEHLDADQITLAGNDPDNCIVFSFSIVLQTKKQ